MFIQFRKLTLALCLFGISSTSMAEAVLVKSQQNIAEYKLDNGLRVILAPNDKETKVYMNMVYLTGALNDPQGKGGLAHLLEHLAFKGTKNVKEEEFQRRLDQFTLMSNARTDYYSTSYINVLRPEKEALQQLIYLESERMDKLVLKEKFVPAEINIVMREREVRMDQPFSVLMDQIWKSAYGNKYLGRLPIGDLVELQSIKMNELEQFYRSWYAPNNAVLIISGQFDQAEVLQDIDKNFSHIKARQLPRQVKVPLLDPAKMKNRNFIVKKGSDLAQFNIYMDGKNSKIQNILALAPYLYTLQPSGHLYSDMVETGIATQVNSTTWLDKDFNFVLMGAIYSPANDVSNIKQSLNVGVENSKSFDQVELKRVKNLFKNSQDSLMSDAESVGSMLADYVVSTDGDWSQYFVDSEAIQKLSVKDVNQGLKSFLTEKHRISAEILPTPEEQKKALEQQQSTETAKTLDQLEPPEKLKDAKVYKAEVAKYAAGSKKYLTETEAKIQRGQLKNGMQYALFPTSTRDDKTYATLTVKFGSAESLFNKFAVLDFTAYLLLRASNEYSLQNIADKTIESNGSATAEASTNGITIHISAKKEHFNDFFNYMIDVMKNPKFEQSQFDLVKSQSLSSLDRPYTEPETVSALTISRILEKYQPGDLRYHFEPEVAEKLIESATLAQVKALYQDYFAMDHAQIAITGEFDSKQMLKQINSEFGDWKGNKPYQRLTTNYHHYPAQKVHALAEQREFGNYQGYLRLPVGFDHQDATALTVFSYILGDSQLSSRLGIELREKNALVYGFGSRVDLNKYSDAGSLMISANYSAGKSQQVSQVIHKVLKDLLDKGVTEQELEAAKADIMKSRVTVLEDPRSIHRMLNSQLQSNEKMNSRLIRDQQYIKLTKADVDAVIKKYIKLDQYVEVMADQYGKKQK